MLLWLSWQPRPRKSKILMKRKIPTSENNCWRQSAEFLNYRGQENSKQHGSLLCVKQFSKSLRADQTKIGDQKSEMVRDCSKNNRTQNQSIGSLQPQSKSQQWFFFKEINTQILKCMWKCKAPRTVKTIFESKEQSDTSYTTWF